MSDINEILRLLKICLEQNTTNKNFWSISNIKDIAPVVQALVVLITAGAGYWKYRTSKNKEIYEKRLNEVYAPLYMRLVKQEYVRSISLKHLSIEEAPILSLVERKETRNLEGLFSGIASEKEIKETDFLNRTIFNSVMKNVNAGLATQKLLTLIALYESAIYLEDKALTKGTDDYFENAIKKFEIELDLYHEIMRGYQECYSKLKLDKNEKNENWDIVKNEFILKHIADREKINKFKQEYNSDPEKYE